MGHGAMTGCDLCHTPRGVKAFLVGVDREACAPLEGTHHRQAALSQETLAERAHLSPDAIR